LGWKGETKHEANDDDDEGTYDSAVVSKPWSRSKVMRRRWRSRLTHGYSA
jgi:hypothetical protein